MRYALISDVHGNNRALEAVLAEVELSGYEGIVLLGDYVTDFPWSAQSLERVLALKAQGAHVISGNRERNQLAMHSQDRSTWTREQLAGLYFAHEQLDRAQLLDELALLPSQSVVQFPDGARLFLTHSHKDIFRDVGFHISSRDMADRYAKRPFSRADLLGYCQAHIEGNAALRQRVAHSEYDGFASGHNHTQWHGFLDGKLMVNPGSCGLPLDCVPGAPYTVVWREGGAWRVEEKRASYDAEEVSDALLKSEQAQVAAVWTSLVHHEFTSCREVVSQFFEDVDALCRLRGIEGEICPNEVFHEVGRRWGFV